MLKTIKTTKQMRLDELVKYVWENGIENENYYSDLGSHVSVGVQTLLWTKGTIVKNETFTVEVEEQITEDTVFNTLVDVNNNDEVHIAWNDSISLYDKEQTKEIHAIIDGKLQLIWKKRELINKGE